MIYAAKGCGVSIGTSWSRQLDRSHARVRRVDCCSSGPPAWRGKYQLIPDRHLILQDFAFTDAEWDSLRVPVGIYFLLLRGG